MYVRCAYVCMYVCVYVNILLQVKPDFRSEMHFAECKDIEEGTGDKYVKEHLASWRQKSATLAVEMPDPGACRKRYRGSAYEWTVCLENILRISANLPGLIYFQILRKWVEELTNCQDWPRLNVFPDEGSDGKSGGHALQDVDTFCLNLHVEYDISHGVSNNHLNAVTHSGNRPLMLLAAGAINGTHAPFDEDRFWQTIKLCCKEFFNQVALVDDDDTDPDPILEAAAEDILSSRNQLHRLHEPGIYQTVLKELKEAPLINKKGPKLSMTRFLDVVKAMKRQDQEFAVRGTLTKVAMIFLGKYNHKKLDKLMQIKLSASAQVASAAAGGAEQEAARQTTKEKATAELSKIRDATDNTLTLMWYYYHDVSYMYRTRIIWKPTSPTMEWYSDHATTCRSGPEQFKWYCEQATGGVQELFRKTFATLGDAQMLQDCGLIVRRDKLMQLLEAGDVLEPRHPLLQSQNERSALLLSYVQALVFETVRRFVTFIVGWPERCFLLGHPSGVIRNATALELKGDWDIAERMKHMNFTGLTEHNQHGCFTMVRTRQSVGCLIQTNWIPCARTQARERENKEGLTHSVMAEEVFQKLRHGEAYRAHHKMADYELMDILVRADITSRLNRYERVNYQNVPVPRQCKLPDGAHQMVAKHASLKNLHRISDFQQKGNFYSPGWQYKNQRAMWLLMNRYMDRMNCFEKADDSWMSCLLEVCPSRPFAIIDTSSPPNLTKGRWHIVLGVMGSTCAVGWPTHLYEKTHRPPVSVLDALLGFGDCDLLELDFSKNSEPVFLPVLDPSVYRVRRLEIMSPAAQMHQRSEYALTEQPGKIAMVRYVCVTHDSETLIIAACEEAFFKLSKSAVVRIARHFGPAGVTDKMTLFRVLKVVIVHHLKIEDPDTSERLERILRKRLLKDPGTEVMEDLLKMQGAVEQMKKGDKEEVKKLQKEQRDSGDSRKKYKQEYRQLRTKVREKKKAVAEAKAKAKGGGGRGRGGRGRGGADPGGGGRGGEGRGRGGADLGGGGRGGEGRGRGARGRGGADRDPAARRRGPGLPIPEDLEITQPQLKALLVPLPGALVWGDYQEKRWRATLDEQSFQRRWQDGRVKRAGLLLLRDLYAAEGFTMEDCPVEGLFDQDLDGEDLVLPELAAAAAGDGEAGVAVEAGQAGQAS